MWEYRSIYYDNELFHHGIKGQKWGIRRYQNKDGSRTAAGKQQDKYNRTIRKYVKAGKARVDNLSHYKVGETTFTNPNAPGKKFVSGLSDGHDFDWQEVSPFEGIGWLNPAEAIKMDSNTFKMDYDTFDHERGKITKYDLEICNPDFGARGTVQNCAKCAATLELRKRGYDVTAGRQTYPSDVDAESVWFKGAKRVEYDPADVDSAVRSYGNNTSGMVSIEYPSGGGHAMHWSVDTGGHFQVSDGQNGQSFSSIEDMAKAYGADTSKKISITRLDNCEPDLDAMAQDSVISIRHAGSQLTKVRNRWDSRLVDTW